MKKEFSASIIEAIEKDYIEALHFFGPMKEEVDSKIGQLTGLESLFTKFLYAYMPISDVGAYDFETMLSYATHAAFLFETSPYMEQIPEEYFLNYVLDNRINSEDITDCRRFFYDQVIGRIKGLSMEEAVIEVNNWCYEQATYRSTSVRTASPITVYKGGFGRCGEESTFLVTVLRSVGIPARQVYVPRWSHSDDNHAWIEAWCDDCWKYTGACEPKPIMFNGWFTYAASRAMIAHSRITSGLGFSTEEVVERDGIITAINNTDMYAHTSPLKVNVTDVNGKAIEGAIVHFEIVNEAEFFPIAAIPTDKNGAVIIHLGLGDVLVNVLYDGKTAYRFVDNKETDEVTIVLEEKITQNEWIDYRMTAPESAVIHGVDMTPEQEKEQDEKNKVGDQLREDRINSCYDETFAAKYEAYAHIKETLFNSKGNFDEIRKFLEDTTVPASLEQKNTVLKYISLKDCRDIQASVLLDQLDGLRYEGKFDQDIFAEYVLAGRIFIETSSPYRAFLRDYYKEQGEELVKQPVELWNKINQEIKYYPEKEYTTIMATPISALKTKAGSMDAKKILFVAICRTFGLASRLDPIYQEPQYYTEDGFVFVRPEFAIVDTTEVTFVAVDAKVPEYYRNFTVGYRQPDGSYESIDLRDKEFTNRELKVQLAAGEYRIVTADRMSSGSIVGTMYYFTLGKEPKTFEISTSKVKATDFMIHEKVEEFVLEDKDGTLVSSKKFDSDCKNVVMFVEPGKEPTEHLFNEMLEICNMAAFPECNIHLVLKKEFNHQQETYLKFLHTYKDVIVWTSDMETALDVHGKATGADTKKLPVVTVMNGNEEAIYGCCGYQIGSADLIARLVRGE